MTEPAPSDDLLDALIIGTGVAGILQLHRLREQGRTVLAVDAAPGVGGTWNWNRYPGARVDSESYTYGYYFSEELLADWTWTEHFCSQPENEAYLNHVVDRFGLREHIRLRTAVTAATYDDGTDTWTVRFDDGTHRRARFVITAVGILSAPQYPAAPGREDFQGVSAHTARWPHEPVEVEGRRVGVIGTGSSGVQLITAIADRVGELTVFQRTPNWCPPLNNGPLTAADMTDLRGRYQEIWAACQALGSVYAAPAHPASDLSPAQRRTFFEDLLDSKRGLASLYANFVEVMVDPGLNREFAAVLADRIRARVDDPAVAERLVPRHHFGVKRPPLETGYYEVYNRDNVTLVDLLEEPIERITRTGVRTAAQDYDLDVLVYATGFDAVTGSFDRIDITGARGVSHRDVWKAGALTHVGVATPGFPNLLYVGGPQSLVGNIPRVVEHQVEFVSELVGRALDDGVRRVEVTQEAAQAWTDHVEEVVDTTLYRTGQSWMYGSNTPGKARAFGLYAGGLRAYVDRLNGIRADGYTGFVLSTS
ncbi:flavin-containing monooxygenase [Pseudonocardia pini]|uniref:flavin-containing monooxygenase n=1 Tax=Pseudonocardia pini TaxID=2758030 RepID=UPI0015F0ADCD|nr:NAD(P)/FAD-dependent oxidoreductase [Pseudonocardia pini]